ncbi:TIGR02530 family flagellar biosynthesis protein [Clostridium paraputrificum]|uniref:TIGR02530 family flagellar biosynthesis protein n=1 Tax=Clostridium TaxID=1485 RepID=UPI003D3436B2
MGYRIVNGRAFPVGDIGAFQNVNTPKDKASKESNFKDILNKTIEEKKGFTLSKHAAERLKEVNFSESDMKNIEKGFKLAEDKGSKNSVMLYKDVAIIASIENKTVITAVDKNRSTDNVFTNVDSVVLL